MCSFDKSAVAAIAVLSAFLLASIELRAADRLCVAERGKSSGYRIVLPDNPRPSDIYAAEELVRYVRVRTDKDRFGRVPEFGSVRISGLTVNGHPAVPGADVLIKTNVSSVVFSEGTGK